mgnify:CR=1 FL=1
MGIGDIKIIKTRICIYEFKISFSYETKGKGYYREQQRIIQTTSRDMCEKIFKEWVKEQRTMDNVKILSVEEINKKMMEL